MVNWVFIKYYICKNRSRELFFMYVVTFSWLLLNCFMIMPYASYVVSNVLWNLDKLIPEAVINADIMIPFLFIRIVSDIINVYTLLHLQGKCYSLIFAVGYLSSKQLSIYHFLFFITRLTNTEDICKFVLKKYKVKDCFVKSSTSLSHWQER